MIGLQYDMLYVHCNALRFEYLIKNTLDIEKAKGYFIIAGGNYILVHWEQCDCAKYDYVPREICVGIIYGLIWKSSLRAYI